MLKRNIHYQKHNPFRRPNWRFDRVAELVGRMPTPGRCSRHDDVFIRKARSLVLRYRARDAAERQELFYEDPGLFYAYELYARSDDEPALGFIAQARLLAGQPSEEIATLLDTIPEAIDWYEKLFFHVRDRLDRRDWITAHVLLPAITEAVVNRDNAPAEPDDDDAPFGRYVTPPVCKPFLDGTLKFFAYFGGPMVLDIMLTGFRPGNKLSSYEGFSAWMDDQWAQSIRRRAAQAASMFDVNKFNVMDLFATHARIMELARIAEVDGSNTTDLERGVQGMLDALPWSVGSRVREHDALAVYDVEAAELRDSELMTTAVGEPPDTLPAILKMNVPDADKRAPAAMGGPR